MDTRAFKMHGYCRLEKEEDVHKAAHTVWMYFHPWHPCCVREYVKAEMHDTETRKTWAVDRNGHTKKDYRSEKTDDFMHRYGGDARLD